MKITGLPARVTAVLTDIVAIVDAAGGTPATWKATLAQIRAAFMPVVLTADVTGVLPMGNMGAPTGTGFTHQVAGTTDVASKKVDLTAAADVTVPATSNGIITSSGAVLQQVAGLTAGAGYITAGPGASAPTVGIVRLLTQSPGGSDILLSGRYNGTTDYPFISFNASTNLVFGADGATNGTHPSGYFFCTAPATSYSFQVGGAEYFGVSNSGVTVGTGTKATAGDVRVPAAFKIAGLNTGTDAALITLGASGSLTIGDTSQTQNIYGSYVSHFFRIGANDTMTVNGSNILAAKPIIGDTVYSSPYAVHGMTVKAMTGTTDVLTAAEYKNNTLKVTGTGTNVVKFPAQTDATGIKVYVWNAGSGTLAVQDTNAVAAAATLAAGTGAWFQIATSAVKQLTAAFTVA